jgi:hypothetical protein
MVRPAVERHPRCSPSDIQDAVVSGYDPICAAHGPSNVDPIRRC